MMPMDDAIRTQGRIRTEAMEWALRTATPGEAADKVMARAVYYADWVGEVLRSEGLGPVLKRLGDAL